MTDPLVLDELSLEGVARYIKSEKCKRIFVMAGAGISTSAGIPDFRSPDTGIYVRLSYKNCVKGDLNQRQVKLARLNLPYPEAVFDIGFFRKNPHPFYTLAHELAPGRFRPTQTHSFIRLLHEKNLLHTCFTQNIDTLERKAGLPGDKIVEAHGSFASQRCIDCKLPFDDAKLKAIIRKKEIPKCERCAGLVKPDIVFFGEDLPPLFHRSLVHLPTADLLIILGTSLTVYPFAALTRLVPDSCPRVLINLEQVGDVGSRADDVVVLGKCDDIVRRLSVLLGWERELDALWDETKACLELDDGGAFPAATAEEEVHKLTDEVEKSLKLTPDLDKVTGIVSHAQGAEEDTSGSGAEQVVKGTGAEQVKGTEAEHVKGTGAEQVKGTGAEQARGGGAEQAKGTGAEQAKGSRAEGVNKEEANKGGANEIKEEEEN